ncbi:bifunctional diguanylate cyclase/phosphodiesterase [Caminibacter sp.]
MKSLMEVLKFFNSHPFVFAVLYKEKIVFMNESFMKKIGLSEEEYKNVFIYDLIKDEKIKEEVKKSVLTRIKGEVFTKPYKHIELNTKTKERLNVTFFAQTIEFEGEFYGLTIGFDSTKEYKKEFLIEILNSINESIISQNNEIELFKNIAQAIYNKGKYKFIATSVNKNFFIYGVDKEFLKHFRLVIENEEHKNKIMVINDMQNFNCDENILRELQKKDINSFIFIPIYKNDSFYASICIASEYKNDFDEVSINIFKEAKKEIEFAIEKIERFSYLEILKEAIDKTFAWVVITDSNARILFANKTVEELSKYSVSELLGKNPKIFKSGYHSDEFYKKLWEKLKKGEVVETLIINKNKNGELFYLKDRIVPVKASSGDTYYISLGVDITSEHDLKKKLKKDILTNLPNRSEFIEKSQSILNKNEKAALLVIDISDFKIYNQIYGNESGDYILKEFAKFLRTFFYEEDIVARIGGDEFAVLFKVHSYDEVEKVINKFIDKLKNSYEFKNKFAVNVGIALYPKDDKDIVKLLEKAIFALQMAKEKGDFAYEYFNKIYDKKIIEYYDVKNLIIEAIQKKEFIYHFQPYVDSKTHKIVGAETLIRIQKEDKVIYPNVFIDFLENSNYIKEVEKIMFPKYLGYLREIKIPLSFNVSGRSLADMEHIDLLFREIKNLPIIIELTEREIAFNIDYTKKVFEYFKNKNIKLSIDDFGTGYSSLTYLKDLPADFLKIDMSFVKNIENSSKDRAIVETIIHFAHSFNLKTIAEGVESEEQVKILTDMGCDYLQGYYFYKPMSFNELKKILS